MMEPAAERRCLAIVLAAGEGTRMRSALPKVLHPVAGRPMLGHVLAAVSEAGIASIALVVGPGREDVAKVAAQIAPHVEVFTQSERRGTGHAVLAARDAIARGYDDIVVLYADAPLIQSGTVAQLTEALAGGATVAALGFEAADPTGYGRLITEDGALVAIREHKDASDAERLLRFCNSGLMAIDGQLALSLLDAIGSDNAQGEYYLTDIVDLACRRGHRCVAPTVDEREVMGVNDRVQLAAVEGVYQDRLRTAAMRAGATLQAPEAVFLSFDTRLGRDVVVEPHVVFAPGVTIGDRVVIHAFSHLEGATVEEGASVGPYARLRPGAKLGRGAKVGNFVEVKNADIEPGAKVNHLSYIGDARVGARANIGAGVITCNYDGFGKFRTDIGEDAFVGSNSSLVAPVSIGRGAMVGSGSVITAKVPDDALAISRVRQTTKDGWAVRFRDARSKAKLKSTPS